MTQICPAKKDHRNIRVYKSEKKSLYNWYEVKKKNGFAIRTAEAETDDDIKTGKRQELWQDE